jgi:hypothetical protein
MLKGGTENPSLRPHRRFQAFNGDNGDWRNPMSERRVEEGALLAVLEALGEWDDLTADEFAWDEILSDESPMDSRPGGDLSVNAISA